MDPRDAAGITDDREQSLGDRAVRLVRALQHRCWAGRGRCRRRSIPRNGRALALKTDGNGRYTYLDPRVGGRIAVAEAARNVACVGARPLAITNCLNFGNPTRPPVYYQLQEAIAGMGEACRALGTPVTGGNVSLYNESPAGPIYPTPVVGMVGLIESFNHVTRAAFPDDAERGDRATRRTDRWAWRQRIPGADSWGRSRAAARVRSRGGASAHRGPARLCP